MHMRVRRRKQGSQFGLGCHNSPVAATYPRRDGLQGRTVCRRRQHAERAHVRGSGYLDCLDARMGKRFRGGGRPSKGDRHGFRVGPMPADEADRIMREAAVRNMPYTEYIAVVVADALGFDTALPAGSAVLPTASGGPAAAGTICHDNRRLFARIPRAVANVVFAEADARDMPYAEYLAAIVARAHGIPATLPEPVYPLQPREEALSISA